MLVNKDALLDTLVKRCENHTCREIIPMGGGKEYEGWIFCDDCFYWATAMGWYYVVNRSGEPALPALVEHYT